ncbi:MAG: hypothetical protein JW757_07305, partial [Anaerolineales bacterium]|nr:hypothetical protein [Anaerolineales bacterium]
QVAAINEGHYSVPTLVFPDKSALTEPSPAVLVEKLESMGFTVDARALRLARKPNLLRSPAFLALMMLVLYGILRALGVV